MRSLALVCLLANINPFVKADQPVHCLVDNAMGEWEFHVSAEQKNVDLFKTNEVCSHMKPNHVQIVNADHEWNFAKESTWKVTLGQNYQVTATNGSQSSVGTWSTIYDQAMRVELDNGLRFITNFRYNVKQSLS